MSETKFNSDDFYFIWIAFEGISICCKKCRWANQPPRKDEHGGIEQVTLTALTTAAIGHYRKYHMQ